MQEQLPYRTEAPNIIPCMKIMLSGLDVDWLKMCDIVQSDTRVVLECETSRGRVCCDPTTNPRRHPFQPHHVERICKGPREMLRLASGIYWLNPM